MQAYESFFSTFCSSAESSVLPLPAWFKSSELPVVDRSSPSEYSLGVRPCSSTKSSDSVGSGEAETPPSRVYSFQLSAGLDSRADKAGGWTIDDSLPGKVVKTYRDDQQFVQLSTYLEKDVHMLMTGRGYTYTQFPVRVEVGVTETCAVRQFWVLYDDVEHTHEMHCESLSTEGRMDYTRLSLHRQHQCVSEVRMCVGRDGDIAEFATYKSTLCCTHPYHALYLGTLESILHREPQYLEAVRTSRASYLRHEPPYQPPLLDTTDSDSDVGEDEPHPNACDAASTGDHTDVSSCEEKHMTTSEDESDEEDAALRKHREYEAEEDKDRDAFPAGNVHYLQLLTYVESNLGEDGGAYRVEVSSYRHHHSLYTSSGQCVGSDTRRYTTRGSDDIAAARPLLYQRVLTWDAHTHMQRIRKRYWHQHSGQLLVDLSLYMVVDTQEWFVEHHVLDRAYVPWQMQVQIDRCPCGFLLSDTEGRLLERDSFSLLGSWALVQYDPSTAELVCMCGDRRMQSAWEIRGTMGADNVALMRALREDSNPPSTGALDADKTNDYLDQCLHRQTQMVYCPTPEVLGQLMLSCLTHGFQLHEHAEKQNVHVILEVRVQFTLEQMQHICSLLEMVKRHAQCPQGLVPHLMPLIATLLDVARGITYTLTSPLASEERGRDVVIHIPGEQNTTSTLTMHIDQDHVNLMNAECPFTAQYRRQRLSHSTLLQLMQQSNYAALLLRLLKLGQSATSLSDSLTGMMRVLLSHVNMHRVEDKIEARLDPTYAAQHAYTLQDKHTKIDVNLSFAHLPTLENRDSLDLATVCPNTPTDQHAQTYRIQGTEDDNKSSCSTTIHGQDSNNGSVSSYSTDGDHRLQVQVATDGLVQTPRSIIVYKAARTEDGQPCMIKMRLPQHAQVVFGSVTRQGHRGSPYIGTKGRTSAAYIEWIRPVVVTKNKDTGEVESVRYVLPEQYKNKECQMCNTGCRVQHMAYPCKHKMCGQCRRAIERTTSTDTTCGYPGCHTDATRWFELNEMDADTSFSLKYAYSFVYTDEPYRYERYTEIVEHNFDVHVTQVCRGVGWYFELSEQAAALWLEYWDPLSATQQQALGTSSTAVAVQ